MPMLCLRLATRFSSVGNLMDALAKLRARRKCFVQAFDPKAIVSERHLLLAYENARAAFEERRNVARNLETEVLVRAGGTRKISEALERVGVKDAGDVVVMGDCKRRELMGGLGAKEIKPTFEPDEREIVGRFGLSPKVTATYSIEEGVLEMVALADVAD